MQLRLRAAAASAALLQAFAFSAHAEELHKDGSGVSGVKLGYETTTLADGRLQIEFTLECREKNLQTTYGAAVVAVVNKSGAAPDIQKNQLNCQSTGGQDRVTVVKKVTGKVLLSGVTPADIGAKVFVIGRSKADESPKLDRAIARLEEAVQKEIDKAVAG
jgi:hypothetical protein